MFLRGIKYYIGTPFREDRLTCQDFDELPYPETSQSFKFNIMNSVTVEQTFEAKGKEVWEALTDEGKLRKWFFNVSAFKPVEGFEFSFSGQGRKGEQYVHRCRVTQVVPLKKLQYSWQYENMEGLTFVTFELLEEDARTHLRITHTGFETFPADKPDFAPESFKAGWDEIITRQLKAYLKEGQG